MRKKLFTFFCAMIISMSSIVNVHAGQPILGGRLMGGIGDYNQGTYRYYWLDSSLKTNLVTTGIDGWNHSSRYSGVFSKINFVQTTNRPSSAVDFYGKTLAKYTLGETSYFRSNGDLTASDVESWSFCRISINTSSTASGSVGLTDWKYIRTSSHEMGHALGFNENNTAPDSIMCQTENCSLKYNYPIKSDINTLNSMY